MKFTKKLFVMCMFVAIAIVAISITSCKKEADGDSVDDCMSKFKTAVNSGNYLDIGELLSNNASWQSQGTTKLFWENIYGATTKGDFNYVVSGETAIAKYDGDSRTFTFTLEKNDEDYRILKIIETGNPTPVFQ